MTVRVIGALAACAALFMAGYWVASNHAAVEVAALKLEAAKVSEKQALKDAELSRDTLEKVYENNERFQASLERFDEAIQVNNLASRKLDGAVRTLAVASDRVQRDFGALPQRIASAAQPALSEYASTCTAVFRSMVAGGQHLVDAGAGISRLADGHAADAAKLHGAWPKN